MLAPGVATLSRQGGSSWYDLEAPGWHWVVHFSVRPGGLAVPAVVALGADAAYARTRMAHIAALHARRGEPAACTAAGAALLDLLAWLALRGHGRTESRTRGDAAIERVAALVREEPDRPWRSGELARRVGISPNWLAARFRGRFGMTIDRYRLQQRVEMARILLGSTTLPVAEVGRRVGLPDPQHFNKVFRAVVGVPPSACRGEVNRHPAASHAPGPVRGVQGVR